MRNATLKTHAINFAEYTTSVIFWHIFTIAFLLTDTSSADLQLKKLI